MTLDENNALDFVKAAVTDLTAIGFTSSVRLDGEKIVITLRKGKHDRSFTIGAEFQEADSDALTDALRMPMERYRLELAKLDAKKPPKAKKKAKKRKAKKHSVKLVGASKEVQDAADDALEPLSPTTEDLKRG